VLAIIYTQSSKRNNNMKDYVNTPKPPSQPPKRTVNEDINLNDLITDGAQVLLVLIFMFSMTFSLGVFGFYMYGGVNSAEIFLGASTFVLAIGSGILLFRQPKKD